MKNFFKNYFYKLNQGLVTADNIVLEDIAKIIQQVSSKGKKIIVVGNGGSAAMASHVTVDLTKVAGIRAINFNEADLLTCFSNDFGYENWVKKALEFYADPGDLLILISSSGKSPNILNGAKKAKEMGIFLITLSGFAKDNALNKLGDLNLWIDSSEYNIIEMTHHVWLLAIVDYIIEKK
tara:strand:+ start:1597 stop:2136 length:540 start_codon:yes stop_codon:yes gene_type:complete